MSYAQILLKLGAAHSHASMVREVLVEIVERGRYTLTKGEVESILRLQDECVVCVARAADLAAAEIAEKA